ncbi:MAG: lycopene cyclase domain-containing protein [Cyclobacteriaceae bacterium]
MPVYLMLHIGTVAFPLLWSWDRRVSYHQKWFALFPALIVTAILFLVWDAIFTSLGVWGFNHDYTVGVFMLGMPIEEWLFFINMPFATLFIYECVRYYFPNAEIPRIGQSVLVFGVMLIGVGVLSFGKLYTSVTFLLTGVAVLFIAIQQPRWLAHFSIAYLFHLVPFFLVNGVLTGSLLDDPIVWYDNAENLGIRVGTIPIEDSIYSMLLMLLNVIIYEKLLSRQQTIVKQKG